MIATAVDMTIDEQSACSIFSSCYKSDLYQSIEATKKLTGFFRFMGEGSISQRDNDHPEDTSCKLTRPHRLLLHPREGERAKTNDSQSPLRSSLRQGDRRLRLRSDAQSEVPMLGLREELSRDRLDQDHSSNQHFRRTRRQSDGHLHRGDSAGRVYELLEVGEEESEEQHARRARFVRAAEGKSEQQSSQSRRVRPSP